MVYYGSNDMLIIHKRKLLKFENEVDIEKKELKQLNKELNECSEQMKHLRNKIKKLGKIKKEKESALKVTLENVNETKGIVENFYIIKAIVVDSQYECENGFIGMNRDILARLMKTMKYKEIRNVVGMGQQCYFWKNQRAWKFGMLLVHEEHAIIFLPKTASSLVTYSGSVVSFGVGDSRTVLIEQDLSLRKKYVLEVEVTGWGCIGLALKSMFPEKHTVRLNETPGTCTLTYFHLFVGPEAVAKNPTNWSLGSLSTCVRLELDQIVHTLHFIINSRRLEYCVTNVPLDVFFAISKGGNAVVNARSLYSYLPRRTEADTDASTSVVCTPCPWKA